MKPKVTKAKVVRWIGISLFILSFPAPSLEFGEMGTVWNFKDSGFGAFWMTPVVLIRLLGVASEWRICAAGIALAAAWLANFTVFFRFPRQLAWAPIAAPWILFVAFMLDWFSGGSGIAGFLPFYLWAIGIGFIHLSVYLQPPAAGELARSPGRP